MNLRKLTRKSIMGFGKYPELSVQELLDLKKTSYLRGVYYRMSQINFFDDILEELGILEYKIEKPGKDIETLEYVNKLAEMKMTGFSKLKHKTHGKSVKKAQFMSFQASTRVDYFKKSALRNRNQSK